MVQSQVNVCNLRLTLNHCRLQSHIYGGVVNVVWPTLCNLVYYGISIILWRAFACGLSLLGLTGSELKSSCSLLLSFWRQKADDTIAAHLSRRHLRPARFTCRCCKSIAGSGEWLVIISICRRDRVLRGIYTAPLRGLTGQLGTNFSCPFIMLIKWLQPALPAKIK